MADSRIVWGLQAIRGLIDHLEDMKRELCLESTRLSSDEAAESLGPGAEVALAGTSHATDYLSLCRTRIMENDLTLAGRVRAKLEGSSRNAFIAGDRGRHRVTGLVPQATKTSGNNVH